MAEQQPNAQQQQPQAQQPAQQTNEQPQDQTPRTYTHAEWEARQADFDAKADKIRRNAAREERRRVEREQAARQPQPERQEQAADPDPEPKREESDDYETHQRKVAAWEGRKAAREERAKEQKQTQEKAQREAAETAARTWHGKIEAAMKKHDDFEDVLEDNQAVLGVIYSTNGMRTAITESDIGPEVVLHLCKNPQEVERIKALPGYKQAAEIVKIEDALLAAGKKPEPKAPDGEEVAEEVKEDDRAKDAQRDTKTGQFKKEPPAPIEPGSGRSASSSALPSDKDDPETWRRKELARIAAKERAQRVGK